MLSLSIVVATRGRHSSLFPLLASLMLDPASPGLQVIIVEDGPPYMDTSIIEQFWKLCRLKVVRHDRRGGIGAARNSGIEIADGDILAFLDDDCICSGHWVSAVLKAFNLWGCQVVGGVVLAADKGANLFSALRQDVYYAEVFGAEYFQIKSLNDLETTRPDVFIPYASGGNSAYRREIFDRYGQFRIDLPAYVDVEMGTRLRGDDLPVLNRAMIIKHRHPQRMSTFLRRSISSGCAKGILCREGRLKHHRIGNWRQIVYEVCLNLLIKNFERSSRLRHHGFLKAWWILTLSEIFHLSGFFFGLKSRTRRL